MSGKRIGKSMVDWVAFSEVVSPTHLEYFRAFKGKSDMFASRVFKHPENIQPIDFEMYKSKIPNKALVAEFEKAYKSLAVPFPKDKNNMMATVEADEKKALEEAKKAIDGVQAAIISTKALIEKIKGIPKGNEMTLDMLAYYFPERALNPWEKPTFWPHNFSEQPENDPDTKY